MNYFDFAAQIMHEQFAESAPPPASKPAAAAESRAETRADGADSFAVPRGNGWIVQIVGPAGVEHYLRDGIEDCLLSRATVYADEDRAVAAASEHEARCAGQRVYIDVLSLEAIRSGP